MRDDVGARTVALVLAELARRLGLGVEVGGRAARGTWQGAAARLDVAAGPHLRGSLLRVVVELTTGTDLDATIGRRTEGDQ